MKYEFQSHCAALAELIARLDYAPPGNASEISDIPAAHMELLDFDLLRKVLMQAHDSLLTAQALQQENEFVQIWFKNRIDSLQRARLSLKHGSASNHCGVEHSNLPLPQLLRLYESELAALRAVSGKTYPLIASTSQRADYAEFQS